MNELNSMGIHYFRKAFEMQEIFNKWKSVKNGWINSETPSRYSRCHVPDSPLTDWN